MQAICGWLENKILNGGNICTEQSFRDVYQEALQDYNTASELLKVQRKKYYEKKRGIIK